ncbi:adenylate/guanylate cyclase domain-containing protein [Halorhodospira halochloris]|uniref:CHASE2 domain-containing protein n=1 Tax=Halorhodospira halochloris TaxID=1052 RepID=UPI001EE8FCAE|nr:adenylate/guanylate cyclase domain-containing protein [Halorhodospira halochloris]MCG5530777.1 adenylate/guanylate cyclase domain-containing protein [Halorhodospira halochloris]
MIWRRARDKAWPLILGLTMLIAVVWAAYTQFGPVREAVDTAERFFYDQRLLWTQTGQDDFDTEVVVIDIDESSLARIGRWPWPRATVAELTERLWDAGVVVIGYDVVFAEPERNIAEQVAQAVDDPQLKTHLARLREQFDGDKRLADSLSKGDSVLGFILHSDQAGTKVGSLPPPTKDSLSIEQRPLTVFRLPSATASRPELVEAASASGFFTVRPDPDGVVRRAPLLLGYEDKLYSSLALEVVRQYQLLHSIDIISKPFADAKAIDRVELGGLEIPTDYRGQVLIPYRGPEKTFPYVSAADVLEGKAAEEELEGKIALLGTSALGLYDLRPTPVGSAYPGVEVHATLIDAMLKGDFPRQPAWAEGADFITLMSSGLLLTATLPFLAPLSTLILVAALLAAVIATNLRAWAAHGIVLSIIPTLAAVTLITFVNLGWGFLFEYRRRNMLRQRFGEYVPPELVEQMAERPDEYNLEGETREITLLFADIRGFTTLSEKLDAATLKSVLNRFFTPMTRIIFEHHGTIDKYVGDMIMAFWGAPMDDPEQRKNALEAAFAMLRETDRLKEEFAAEGLPAIEIGIGLNTGPASVGDMGSEYRRAYTALGDSVNLAARTESKTKDYGVRLLVTEHTREGLEKQYSFREIERVQVKGRNEPVTMYEPIGGL